MFALKYTDTTNEPKNIVLDVTNSFVSTTATANAYTAGKWYVNKPVYKDRVLTGPHGPFNYPNF